MDSLYGTGNGPDGVRPVLVQSSLSDVSLATRYGARRGLDERPVVGRPDRPAHREHPSSTFVAYRPVSAEVLHVRSGGSGSAPPCRHRTAAPVRAPPSRRAEARRQTRVMDPTESLASGACFSRPLRRRMRSQRVARFSSPPDQSPVVPSLRHHFPEHVLPPRRPDRVAATRVVCLLPPSGRQAPGPLGGGSRYPPR
jgi:hypothetical protein